MSQIYVAYSPVAIANGVVNHKYIVYTDDAGNAYKAEAGGTRDYGSSPTEVITDRFPNTRPFGNLEAGYTQLTATQLQNLQALNHVTENIISGQNLDLGHVWDSILDTIDDMNGEQSAYDSWNNNSNTFADRAIQDAGFDLPELDDIGENWAPGSLEEEDESGPGSEEGDGVPAPPPPPLPKDPLVFDLDGDGVELIALAASATFFNMDDDLAAENVAWVDPMMGSWRWMRMPTARSTICRNCSGTPPPAGSPSSRRWIRIATAS